jgi:hypothetical protein
MKGHMMKQVVRIIGRNGVVYEERMTEEQVTQFLRLSEARTSLGVAFNEWEIVVTKVEDQKPYEHERECSISYTGASFL